MQSEARAALMHLGRRVEVDALPLDGSCLSKSYSHTDRTKGGKVGQLRIVVLTSGIDAEHVSSQSLYDNSCRPMPPRDSGGGGAPMITHLQVYTGLGSVLMGQYSLTLG